MVCHPCPSHFDRSSLCSLDPQKFQPEFIWTLLFLPNCSPLSLKLAVGTPHSEKSQFDLGGGIYLSNICLYCTDLYLHLKYSQVTSTYYCTYLFLKYFASTEARNYIYSHITRGYCWTYLYFYLISRCPPPWLVPTSPCNLCIDNGDHDGQW